MAEEIKIKVPIATNGPSRIGGLNTKDEPVNWNGSFSPWMKNFVIGRTALSKRKGYSKLGSNLPLSGLGQRLINWTDALGDKHLLAFTSSMVYEYDSESGTWAPVFSNDPANELQLDDCYAWAANPGVTSVADDSSDYKKGTKSQKFTALVDMPDGSIIGISPTISPALDGSTYSVLSCWLKSSVAIEHEVIRVVLRQGGVGFTAFCPVSLEANVWVRMVASVDGLSAGTAIDHVWLYNNSLAGGAATIPAGSTIKIDDVRLHKTLSGSSQFLNGVENFHIGISQVTDETEYASYGGSALAFCNGVDGLKAILPDRTYIPQPSLTSLSTTRDIMEFWNHFFLLRYNDGTNHARALAYSAIGNIDDFASSPGSGGVVLTDTDGSILRMLKLGFDAVIYSERSITLAKYYGGATIFAFPTYIYSAGLLGVRAVCEYSGLHYLASSDNRLCTYDGSASLTPLGVLIEDKLFEECDMSRAYMVSSIVERRSHKVFFFYPNVSDTYCTRAYATDLKLDGHPWEYLEFVDGAVEFAEYTSEDTAYCDDVDWTNVYCDETDAVCDSGINVFGAPVPCFLSADGYVYVLDGSQSDDGENIECEYQTEDVVAPGEITYVRWNWVSFVAKGSGTLTVQYSLDGGSTWTELSGSPITLSSTWNAFKLPISCATEKIRVRFYQNSQDDVQLRSDVVLRGFAQGDR